jgi:CIC family chloride channel protein
VGVFSASVRAPATGMVLVLELTHSDRLLVPQATTSVVAYLVAAALRDVPIYEALRERTAARAGPTTPAVQPRFDDASRIGNNAGREDTP